MKKFISLWSVLVALLAFNVPILWAYGSPNATTKANLTDQNANLEEELWTRLVIGGSEATYQTNPFDDGFVGEKDGGKFIVKITDTTKVRGNTIHVTTYGGLGGPGTFGSTSRDGAEQKLQAGSFDTKIGTFWVGVAYEAIARDRTMIGTQLDSIIKEGLQQLHAKKRNDDYIMQVLKHAEANARNARFPVASTALTLDTITTANYVDVATVSMAGDELSGIGATPMSFGPMDSGGSRPENFVFFGANSSFTKLRAEDAYTDGVIKGADRGANNPFFKGNLVELSGMSLYSWKQKDHGNWGPVGSPLAPRLYLGTALTGADTGDFIVGGGNAVAAAVTPAPLYTSYFSNAPWTYHDETTVAAVTDVDRYVLIIDATGTWNVYNYRVNDGKKITILARVSIGGTGEGTSHDHAIGALVVECNAIGTPIGRSIAFGQQGLVSGAGSIDGAAVNAKMGRRTTNESAHQTSFGVGAEGVWGCAVVKRADNVAPGFLVITHAQPVLRAPVIS